MAAKKPAKAQAIVTLRNLAAELAESHEVPKKQAEAMLSDMVGLIAKHLKKGNRLRLVGLGILQVRHRAPGDRRGHQDQGQQEGRVPPYQDLKRAV
jgi:DNA-binding protein HU-beta